VRAFECAFLSPSGAVLKIYVPVHSLTNKSTSYDRTLHKQLKSVLLEGEDRPDFGIDRVDSISEFIESTQFRN
jgi:hypothetical protein